MKLKTIFFVLLFAWTLLGCSLSSGLLGTSAPEPALGTTLLTEQFDSSDAWEIYEDDSSSLHIVNGAYQITANDQGFIWGLNETPHQDVVISVDSNQLSAYEDNAYGVICRADTSNNGDGYYFLVSGDGMVSIRKGDGEDVGPLVDWEANSSVNEGVANNSLRAVCIGDYLALYVNGNFAISTNDASFTSGYAGFAAAASEGGDVTVAFDNLTISEAALPAE